MKGVGRAVFVAVLFLMIGVLNVIYGIAAIGNAHFFDSTQFVFSSLHTWGWITVIVGVIQITAGLSLMSGGGYGRVIGIIAATMARSSRCCRSGGRTRGGRWPSSRFVYTSCTASSSSARERRRKPRRSGKLSRIPIRKRGGEHAQRQRDRQSLAVERRHRMGVGASKYHNENHGPAERT